MPRRGESFARQPEHSRQIISAATRNDAQSRLSVGSLAIGHHAVDHLINHSVAADSDDQVEPILQRLARECFPLTPTLGKRDIKAAALRPKHPADLRP